MAVGDLRDVPGSVDGLLAGAGEPRASPVVPISRPGPCCVGTPDWPAWDTRWRRRRCGRSSRTPASPPAPQRAGQTWRAFLARQATTILAADSFHAGTVFLRRLHVLFLIEHGTRRVHLARIIARPAGKWVRNLLTNLEHHADGLKS